MFPLPRWTFLALAPLLVAAAPAFPPRLAEFRDHSLVAIVFAPVADDRRFIAQTDQLQALTRLAAFHDLIVTSVTGSDVIGLSDSASALRARFGVAAGAFRLVLLDKAGASALTDGTVVSAARLSSTIRSKSVSHPPADAGR